MQSIFDVFNIVCSWVWGRTTYSARNSIAFSLSISGYWMFWAAPNFLRIFVFLWTKITIKFFQNTIFIHKYDFFVIFSSNELSMLRTFRLWVSCYLGLYLCCRFTLSSGSSDCCFSCKHFSLELDSISSSPHSSSRLSPISSFSPFSSASQSSISFKTWSNGKTGFVDFLFDFFAPISFTNSSKLDGNVFDSLKTHWPN